MLPVLSCREALRQAENGAGPLAADLADLQRQLAQLMQQPFAFPAGSRASSRPSSRVVSVSNAQLTAAGATAELEPESPLAAGEGGELQCAADAAHVGAGRRYGSPRIRAVHSRAEQQAVECDLALESGSHGGTDARRSNDVAALRPLLVR